MIDMNITKERALWFSLHEQAEGESDSAYRSAIAEKLRSMGYPIEAHEAFHGCLYDDPEGQAVTGIMGMIAREISERQYSGSKIGNDIAAGEIVKAPHNPDTDALLVTLAVLI